MNTAIAPSDAALDALWDEWEREKQQEQWRQDERDNYIRSFLLQASLDNGYCAPAKFAPGTRNGEFQSFDQLARAALDELQSNDYEGLTSRILAEALCHYARTTGDKDARKLMQSLAEVSAGLNN